MLREHGRGLHRLLRGGLRADGKEEKTGDFGRRAEGQERGSSPPVAENLMTKIVLSASRDIPLNKLVLSQANVRRIKAGVSVDELAEDIARRGLLQSLSVRPVLGEQGQETGTYEVPAGGRRFQALQLLVKQKRLAKTAPVPCLVKTDGVAEEDSLAENTMREALHPLDQFRAFQALRDEYGLGDEEIAARFFVTPAVVRQRLKLVAVSPKLLALYAENAMSLEQLTAFTVTNDHARQEQVWEGLARGYNKEPYYIRRLLTEGAAKASDKRAVFVGAEAYEAAGGVIARDLFQHDGGGWVEDVALLDRLAREKLDAVAVEVRAEGWKWLEVAFDFPYGHTTGLRRVAPAVEALSAADQAAYDALRRESDELEAEYEGADELPDAVDARLGEFEQALARWAHFADACAALSLEGDLVHLEDLVLRDAGMDVRMAADGTNRAMSVLRARRLVARRGGAWALSFSGLDALRRRRTGSDHPVTSPRERSDLVYDRDWDEEERLAEWQELVKGTDKLPALVAAAIAFDASRRIAPLQHAGWIGSLLVSALLQTRGKTLHHLAALNVGMRAASYRRAHVQDLGTRIAGFLDGLTAAADRGQKDLDRLTLAREILGVQLNGRRSTSRLPALVDLLLSKPLVSVPLAAKALKVSPQAVEGMMGQLGASARELTGRGRYRAWGII